eukprot:345848-Amphidinium_carterae.1
MKFDLQELKKVRTKLVQCLLNESYCCSARATEFGPVLHLGSGGIVQHVSSGVTYSATASWRSFAIQAYSMKGHLHV